MRHRDVEGFEERLNSDLPVHPRNDFADVHCLIAVFVIPGRKMCRDVAEVVFKRHGIGIQIDKDEAAPDPDLRFGQAKLFVLDLREVPAPWDKAERTVQPPGETVELAGELRDMAAGL